MPRLLPFNFTPPTQRLFHSYARLQNATHTPQPNHYETLKISPSATPAEVKKSFYTLSKAHHPDLHPDDPLASQRFVSISEAYTILGTPAKRALYDRQFHAHTTQDAAHKGSYHSSGPAGGRPPSGLSKRRTHFQGPPPSFYRSGGWGDQGTKRSAAQEGTQPSSNSSTSSSGNSSTSKAPGMGPGSTPFPQYQEVRHFDWREHLRTHENHSRRQRDRRRMMGDPLAGGGGIDEGPGSTLMNVVFVGGIILIAVGIPFVFVKDVAGGGGKKKRDR